MTLDADLERIGWNQNAYALALEIGNYRAACRFAIAELRRGAPEVTKWRGRVRGSFARRNRKVTCGHSTESVA